MSSKFAIRPAPRKKPWICKRSPPCLKYKTKPTKLLASFALAQIDIPFGPVMTFGSFPIAAWNYADPYTGTWNVGTEWFGLIFPCPTVNPAEKPQTGWFISTIPDGHTFPHRSLPWPPPWYYADGAYVFGTATWILKLMVSS